MVFIPSGLSIYCYLEKSIFAFIFPSNMRFFIYSALFVINEAASCSMNDAKALGSIDEEAMTACMGSSISGATLKSCIEKNGGSGISQNCVNCLANVSDLAQTCGTTCASDPTGQACSDCAESLTNAGLECFSAEDIANAGGLSDVVGSTTTTTKSTSGLAVMLAPALLLIALTIGL